MPLNIRSSQEYQPSSSDDEYDENEKRLLQKYRNRKKQDSESETEVFGVGSGNESDDDNQSDIALSDVEGQEPHDDFPDVRAWGKEKRKYYGTDYVDPDYGGYQGKDAHAAEIEEEEAKTLQNQLVQQLDDNDFSLDVLFKKKDKAEKEEKDVGEEQIKTDLSKLSNKQKLQILQKDSPEFFALVDDFKAKMTLAKDYLYPIIQKYRGGKIQNCKAVEFVQTQYQLILNYVTNIYMYLLLKSNKDLQNHPIIKKLFQYRQLLSQIEPVFEEIIKPQIELLLAENLDDKGEKSIETVNEPKKKTLKLLAQLKNTQNSKKTITKGDSEQPSKKIRIDSKIELGSKKSKKVTFTSDHESCDMDVNSEKKEEVVNMDEDGQEDNKEVSEEVAKRAITYQIAKNKGLTPHRKKEFRNPRVKHRIKFRKALIRRKGAVREPRKELTRYSGEVSGIKTSVSKSIKIKS